MKTKFKSTIRAAFQPFGAPVCVGALLLIASSAPAQNLFVSSGSSIVEITPGGAQSIFASGLLAPSGLAFNSAGDLFEADPGSGNIYEFTPAGARSTFATFGENQAFFLAFQGVTLPVLGPSALGLLAVGVTALLVRRRRESWPPGSAIFCYWLTDFHAGAKKQFLISYFWADL